MITHLVETNVMTRLGRVAIAEALKPYYDAECVARCTISDLEIGFFASNTDQWHRLNAALQMLEPIDITPEVINRAKTVQRSFADRSLKGP